MARSIYRGESKEYEQACSSTLYRRLFDINKDVTKYTFLQEQEEYLKKVNRYFEGEFDLPVLSKLQHFGMPTCLIDFSKNILISMFFACLNNDNEDGFIYVLNVDDENEVEKRKFLSIENTNSENEVDNEFEKHLYLDASINNRSSFQSSCFILSPNGYINVESKFVEAFRIDGCNKGTILEGLSSFFNISKESVYDDIHGFIQHYKS